MIVIACAATIGLLVGVTISYIFVRRSREQRFRRIEQINEYMEGASLGKAGVLLPTGEDELSRLQDEISKTVTALYHARAQAVEIKEGYALNLSYIAHQIKTPLAAISLAIQSLDEQDAASVSHSIRTVNKQVQRLKKLQEDLLLMAKIDAGIITMTLKPHDVYTLLSIAVDNLEELAQSVDVLVDIADNGPAEVVVDEHWTCEALTNVLKNCIEHAPKHSVVYIEYEANPLYVEIMFDDEGGGFTSGEENKLFERFYTGARNCSDATGLGLAFAREILELQNSSIHASNNAMGGAHFEIRIYCHSDVILHC